MTEIKYWKDGQVRYTTSVTPNGDGTPDEVTDYFGVTTTYSYSGGRLTGISKDNGITMSISYDPWGNVASYTDPRGKTRSAQYNAYRQKTSETFPDGE